MNSLPKTVIQQHRDCDLNPGPSAPESSMLTTRLIITPRCAVTTTSTRPPAWCKPHATRPLEKQASCDLEAERKNGQRRPRGRNRAVVPPAPARRGVGMGRTAATSNKRTVP